MKNGKLAWGIILLSIGVLILVRRFGWLDFSWLGILTLWPLLLIIIGVSMLPIKNWIKFIIIGFSFFGALYFLPVNDVHCTFFNYHNGHSQVLNHDFYDDNDEYYDDDDTFDSEFEDEFNDQKESLMEELQVVKEELMGEIKEKKGKAKRSASRNKTKYLLSYSDQYKNGVLNLEAVAGEYSLSSCQDNAINFAQDGKFITYTFNSSEVDGKKIIDLNAQKKENWKSNNKNNEVNIELHDKMNWEVNIEVAASEMDLDFSAIPLIKLEIDGAASDIEVKVGDLSPEAHLQFTCAAAEIDVKVPKSVGCHLESTVFLGSTTTNGLIKQEDGSYQSANFDKAEKKLYIGTEATISSFSLTRY